MNFSEFGFSEPILKALSASGYETPTPVQAAAIPWILAGQDVLACAQTGTGKTGAFTLPLIELLAGSRSRARMPRGLIITPTRELALQIQDAFKKYAKDTSLKTALLIGGTSMDEQTSQLERSVDVLIATPGRFLDHFSQGRLLLTDVKVFVIDEADRMLDMGFIPDLKRIVASLPPLRQTLMFSATMPTAIRDLATTFLTRPKEVIVTPSAQTATNVTQRYIRIPGAKEHTVSLHKRQAIRAILGRDKVDSAIIFCNRKNNIAELCRSLKRYGFDPHPLHGDLSQEQRFETLEAFRNGRVTLLVASDVAGRGIDVDTISHVFNFDVPTQADEYVHRIGRTGRAGRSGTAYTLVGPDDMKLFKNILDLIQKDIPEEVLHDVPFSGTEEKDAAPKSDARPERKGSGRTRKSAEPKGVRQSPAQKSAPITEAVIPEMDDVETLIAASVAAAHVNLPPLESAPKASEGNEGSQGRTRRRRRSGRDSERTTERAEERRTPEVAAEAAPAQKTPHVPSQKPAPKKTAEHHRKPVEATAADVPESATSASDNGGRVRRQEHPPRKDGKSHTNGGYDGAKPRHGRHSSQDSQERAFVGFGDHTPAFMLGK